jgi:hypothetical protein
MHSCGDARPCIASVPRSQQEPVVVRFRVTDVGDNRQIDGFIGEAFGGSRSADSAAIL